MTNPKAVIEPRIVTVTHVDDRPVLLVCDDTVFVKKLPNPRRKKTQKAGE